MTTQATPPSEAQQLSDARTALAVHIARIAELEAIVSRQREKLGIFTTRCNELWRTVDELERHCGELGTALAVVEESASKATLS